MAQQLRNIQEEFQECQQECVECQRDYEKAGVYFNPGSACRCCSNGRKMHELHLRLSSVERAWGGIDWTTSRLEKYYNG